LSRGIEANGDIYENDSYYAGGFALNVQDRSDFSSSHERSTPRDLMVVLSPNGGMVPSAGVTRGTVGVSMDTLEQRLAVVTASNLDLNNRLMELNR
jgi:hypothetical protein